MRVIRVNTTAWSEEDFYLVTSLDDDKIIEVLHPIIQAERYGDVNYDNDTLLEALKERYPEHYFDMYTEFDKLTF